MTTGLNKKKKKRKEEGGGGGRRRRRRRRLLQSVQLMLLPYSIIVARSETDEH